MKGPRWRLRGGGRGRASQDSGEPAGSGADYAATTGAAASMTGVEVVDRTCRSEAGESGSLSVRFA